MRSTQGTDAEGSGKSARLRTKPSGLGNVLVASDFSVGGRLATERAAHLPFAPGARVDLVHVVTSNRSQAASDAEVQRRLDGERDKLVEPAAGAFLITSVIHGAHGAPIAALCDRARHDRAEVIVLGRHGTRGMKNKLIGTTAERVVRHGSTSTLIVTTPAAGPYRHPLVAVDLSDSSRLAVELAARMSRPQREEIAVFYVTSLAAGQDDPAIAFAPTPELRRELLFAQAHRRLSAFLASIDVSGHWRPAVQFGDPASWILEAARQRGSDLIAVGSGGKGTLRRALLGSVAEHVMRDAKCDVLVARLPEVR